MKIEYGQLSQGIKQIWETNKSQMEKDYNLKVHVLEIQELELNYKVFYRIGILLGVFYILNMETTVTTNDTMTIRDVKKLAELIK